MQLVVLSLFFAMSSLVDNGDAQVWTQTMIACLRGNNLATRDDLRTMYDCQKLCESWTPTCRSVEYNDKWNRCVLSEVSTRKHLASFEAPCRGNDVWEYAERRRGGSVTKPVRPPIPASSNPSKPLPASGNIASQINVGQPSGQGPSNDYEYGYDYDY